MNPIPGLVGNQHLLDTVNQQTPPRVDTPPVYKPPAITRTNSSITLQNYIAKEKIN